MIKEKYINQMENSLQLPRKELIQYNFKLPYFFNMSWRLLRRHPYDGKDSYGRKIKARLQYLFGSYNLSKLWLLFLTEKISFLLSGLFFSLLGLLVHRNFFLFLNSLILSLLISFLPDNKLKKMAARRTEEIEKAFPSVASTFALLLAAGRNLETALKTSASFGTQNILKKEILQTFGEIDKGISRKKAYYDLALRCRQAEVSTLSMLLLQGLTLGNSNMDILVENLALDSWRKKKERVKKRGAEASAKLVFPMFLIFIAISLLVMAPGFLKIFSLGS